MGKSFGAFLKYPRTPHIFGSKGTDDDKKLGMASSLEIIGHSGLVVEEKIDGSNSAVQFDAPGNVILQNRGQYWFEKESEHPWEKGLTHPQYNLFKRWALAQKHVLYPVLGSRYIMYGEWMFAKHHIFYNELPLAIILAKADTLGALADEQADRMERVEMLKLQALELECFDTPFRPHEDHARFLFFREGMKWHDYKGGFKPFENYCCTVIMMSGLPGAGKDTWIQAKRPGTPVVGLDGIRREMKVGWMDNQGQVIQAAKKRIKEYMASGIDFIFNATNTVWRWRRNYVSLFAQYGAKIEIVYIEPGWPELLNQNKNRPAPVPEKVLHAKYDTLDIPTITECHRVTYI
ncbi:MAG: ATP-binding protein [bacterium]|nr:ATP-binding protein [bacterium]